MQTGEPRPSFLSLIHPSAWKGNSANFAYHDICELLKNSVNAKFAESFGRWHYACGEKGRPAWATEVRIG